MKKILFNSTCKSCRAFPQWFCRGCFQEIVCRDHSEDMCGEKAEIKNEIDEKRIFDTMSFIHESKKSLENYKNIVMKKYSQIIDNIASKYREFLIEVQKESKRLDNIAGNITNFKEFDQELQLESLIYLNEGTNYIYLNKINDVGSYIIRISQFIDGDSNAVNDLHKTTIKNREFLNGKINESVLATIKNKKSPRDIDFIQDLLVELGDKKNKILKDTFKVTESMVNSPIFEELFTNLPDICPNIHKIELNLSPVSLIKPVSILSRFNNLYYLKISSKKDGLLEFPYFFTNLSKIPSLEVLIIEDFHINDSVLEFDHSGFSNLRVLELKNNSIRPNNCSNIFNWIASMNGLEYLVLSKCIIIDECAHRIASVLNSIENLQYFSLHENTLDSNLHEILNVLQSKNSVTELQLYMNKMDIDLWDQILYKITWPSLQSVVLSIGITKEIVDYLTSKNIKVSFKNYNLYLEHF